MRCVIIAGSPDTNSDFLSEVIKPDDYVICADRGCNFAKQAGITPNLVVGDLIPSLMYCSQTAKRSDLFPKRMIPTQCTLLTLHLKKGLMK